MKNEANMEDKKHGKRKLGKTIKTTDRNKYKYVPGNQQEGQGFANKLKEKIFHDYKRLKRREGSQGFDVQKIYKDHQDSDDERNPGRQPKSKKTMSNFLSENARRKKEKEEALAKYKEKKKHRFLKLCKRTSRGQPVLNNQVQLMLEKLQKQREAESRASTSSS
ncbi:hypothetical protein BaRGS_00028367 [Batillaria attramentaria]|uniref:Thyroid transcription factor 1-associated protein 26 n=1 Tax=Batillaria attramentaria TaxID=370345 RepID=A0ABD0K0V5_9CAEN